VAHVASPRNILKFSFAFSAIAEETNVPFLYILPLLMSRQSGLPSFMVFEESGHKSSWMNLTELKSYWCINERKIQVSYTKEK
jgi:hypothetical protein